MSSSDINPNVKLMPEAGVKRSYSHPREAAYAVLYGAKRPMFKDEILRECISRGLMAGPFNKMDAVQIASKINAEIRDKRPGVNRFKRTQPNTFDLLDKSGIYQGMALRELPQQANGAEGSEERRKQQHPAEAQFTQQPAPPSNGNAEGYGSVRQQRQPAIDSKNVVAETVSGGYRIRLVANDEGEGNAGGNSLQSGGGSKRGTTGGGAGSNGSKAAPQSGGSLEKELSLVIGSLRGGAASQKISGGSLRGRSDRGGSFDHRKDRNPPRSGGASSLDAESVGTARRRAHSELLGDIMEEAEKHVGHDKALAWDRKLRSLRGDALRRVVERAERAAFV